MDVDESQQAAGLRLSWKTATLRLDPTLPGYASQEGSAPRAFLTDGREESGSLAGDAEAVEGRQSEGRRRRRLFAVPVVMLFFASMTLEREPVIALKQAEAQVETAHAVQRSGAEANRYCRGRFRATV